MDPARDVPSQTTLVSGRGERGKGVCGGPRGAVVLFVPCLAVTWAHRRHDTPGLCSPVHFHFCDAYIVRS